MAFKRTNRWDVQVVFPAIAFGIKNRTDVEQTPETVVEALEEFCQRVRKTLAGGNPGAEGHAVTPSASEAPERDSQ